MGGKKRIDFAVYSIPYSTINSTQYHIRTTINLFSRWKSQKPRGICTTNSFFKNYRISAKITPLKNPPYYASYNMINVKNIVDKGQGVKQRHMEFHTISQHLGVKNYLIVYKLRRAACGDVCKGIQRQQGAGEKETGCEVNHLGHRCLDIVYSFFFFFSQLICWRKTADTYQFFAHLE